MLGAIASACGKDPGLGCLGTAGCSVCAVAANGLAEVMPYGVCRVLR